MVEVTAIIGRNHGFQGEAMSKIYVCTYQADDCAFTATCNGFPVFDCKDGGSGMAQLNQHLIGKGNVLRVKFTHKGPGAKFSAGIREAKEGEMVNSLEEGDLAMPKGDELVHTFDSEANELKVLLDSAKPSDAKAMLDFALKYRDAIKGSDLAALRKFNRYRMEEAAKQFGMPLEALAERMLEMFTFFKDGGIDVEAANLVATDLCQGKVWEVERSDGNPLLYKKEEDGSSSSAFIAAILSDGPQVVR